MLSLERGRFVSPGLETLLGFTFVEASEVGNKFSKLINFKVKDNRFYFMMGHHAGGAFKSRIFCWEYSTLEHVGETLIYCLGYMNANPWSQISSIGYSDPLSLLLCSVEDQTFN